MHKPLSYTAGPGAGWAPSVLALSDNRAALAYIATACRRFEPRLHWVGCTSPAEALTEVERQPIDLVVVDLYAAASALLPVASDLCAALPVHAVLLVVGKPEHPVLHAPVPATVDAAVVWSDLSPWLASALPRVRCRVELAALRLDPPQETTVPAGLATL
ncbi:hypothetical protein [Caldimonas brevitalea]|uniref:Response regulatory domain-containing protein n=1 Tax=Caldimonas brevitalea TaxID=413882 RepID=A0A0G3BJ00_9BURK|nr:hypothetical protein [Caldimonas brevitalea]AKJ27973.1 hypothetical protein AAW51_1282 [Caldimonas brevitalea]